MTKPQALPFLVPFAAWFWARGGLRGFAQATAIGLAVVVLVWLPFIPPAGRPNYLQNLGEYQNDIFSVLSLRAWNVWWILQVVAAGGEFASDTTAVLGPITFRHIGYVLTGLLELVVFVAVLRDPRPRTLILGLAASTLTAFCFLTTMHERYAYGALVFLMLLLVERPVRALGDRLRDRLHAQSARCRPTDAGDRRSSAGRRRAERRRLGGDGGDLISRCGCWSGALDSQLRRRRRWRSAPA